MTTISLSATDTLLDLLPGRLAPRKSPQHAATEAAAAGTAASAPSGLRLLPRAWREALVHRARQRELERAFERLSETSAHLLADVGMVETAEAARPIPARTWTRALPAPGESPAGAQSHALGQKALSRSRRRLGEMDDHLLADVGLGRWQAGEEVRRPAWDAPAAWLR